MKTILKVCFAFFLLINVNSYAQSKADVIYYYEEGDEKKLSEVIKTSLEKSKQPVLYFYADWCPPCKKFAKSMKNKIVKEALANGTLIKINVDNDVAEGGQEIAIKYGINVIPTFIKVNAEGEVIAQITSDEWGKDVPKNIASVIDTFINKDTYHMNK